MADNNNSKYVTRREYFSSQSVVWLYIAISLQALEAMKGRGTSGTIVVIVAVGMMLMNTFFLYRSSRSDRLSDRSNP